MTNTMLLLFRRNMFINAKTKKKKSNTEEPGSDLKLLTLNNKNLIQSNMVHVNKSVLDM